MPLRGRSALIETSRKTLFPDEKYCSRSHKFLQISLSEQGLNLIFKLLGCLTNPNIQFFFLTVLSINQHKKWLP